MLLLELNKLLISIIPWNLHHTVQHRGTIGTDKSDVYVYDLSVLEMDEPLPSANVSTPPKPSKLPVTHNI